MSDKAVLERASNGRAKRRPQRFVLTLILSLALILIMFASAPPASAEVGDPTEVAAEVEGLNIGVSWTADNDPQVSGYVITTSPESPSLSVPAGATSAVLTGVRPNTSYDVFVAAVRDGVAGEPIAAPAGVQIAAPGGSFTAVTPVRFLDTRTGLGAPRGATNLVDLQITGREGLPGEGIGAVVLNVTVTAPVAAGYVTAYPSGQARPTASNVNYVKGQTKANLVTVPVGPNGRVGLYSSAKTQLVADVAGYYSTAETASPTSGLFQAVQPHRVMDTRNGLGASTPGPRGSVKVKVTGIGGVPELDQVSAVVLNTTIAGSSASGYVTAFPTDATQPTASTVNFAKGQVVANRTIVPVGSDGNVTFFNSAGSTPVVVDVTGWFTGGFDESASGSYFVPLAPKRLVDTRIGLGAPQRPLGSAEILTAGIAGRNSLPRITDATPPTAVVTTVTLVNPSASTYGTVFPSLNARPLASDINAAKGTVVPNMSQAGLGADGDLAIYNHAGTTHLVVDLAGYFIGAVHVPSSTVVAKASEIQQVQGDPATGAEVTLDPSAARLDEGAILSAGVTGETPNGLLVKVVSATIDNQGRQVLDTLPATLQEAIGSGSLSVSAPLSGDDVIAAEGPGARRATGRTKVLTVSDLAERQARGYRRTPVTSNPVSSPCSADAGSKVTTSFSVEPTLNVEADLGWSYFRPTLRAKAYAQVKQTASAGFSYTGNASCNWSRTLARYTFPTLALTVGPVPVIIVPQLAINLAAGISGNAAISSSVTQTFTAQAGLEYDGDNVTPIKQLSNTLDYQPLALTEANASAKVTLSAELVGKMYGIAGPTITLNATLRATVDPLDTPWWILVFDLTAQAGLRFDISVINVSVETEEFSLYHKVLAQAGGLQNPVANVSIAFDEVPLYTTVTDQYAGLGVVFGGGFEPYTTGDGANPTSPVLSGGGGFGYPLFGRFVNPDGSPRTVSSMALDVGYIDDPGSTEVLAYDSGGRLLATVVANLEGIVRITINKAGIASFVVRSTGVESSGWAIDNVAFKGYDGTVGGAGEKVAAKQRGNQSSTKG